MDITMIRAFGMINWKHLAFSANPCPLCGVKRVFVRLNTDEISVRCLSCRASTITLSLIAVLQQVVRDLHNKEVCELSSRGPLVKYLRKNSKKLTCSEYFESIAPGEYYNGVQCQDVQRLTYPSESFDLCTSTEVFEHVPDDAKGFSEIFRVLKPNGVFVLTVPIDVKRQTVQRATLISVGEIQHNLQPEYHSDPVRGHKKILAYRNYGYDILDRLIEQGFMRAEILSLGNNLPWGFSRPVVVAYKEMDSSNSPNSDPSLIRFASL